MEASKPQPTSPLARILSGIEAGVIGGLAMLALLSVASVLRGNVWWETLNLLGSTFYGSRAFRYGPSQITLAGGALHLAITGGVGAIFGAACSGVYPRRHLMILGTLTGVSWYYLAGAVFWRRINPLVPLYEPQPVTLLSHALFGACLGYMGVRVKEPSAPAVPAAAAPVDSTPVPVETGPLNADASPDGVE